jgi:hypothetical protein
MDQAQPEPEATKRGREDVSPEPITRRLRVRKQPAPAGDAGPSANRGSVRKQMRGRRKA